MKNHLFYFTLLILINSCSFSQGVSITSDGISYSYKGIEPSEIVMIEKQSLKKINNKLLSKYNTYELVLNDILGFKNENGILKVGADLKIIDENKRVIMKYDDMLKDTSLSISDNSIYLYLYIGKQFNFNKQYTLQSKIWDKRIDGKMIDVEYKFTVIKNENTPKFQIENNGIEYSDIILIDENKNMCSNIIRKNKPYFLLINDLKNFEIKENRINVRESYVLLNLKNEILTRYRNTATNINNEEVKNIDDLNPYVFPISFTSEQKENQVKLGIMLEDMNNQNNFLKFEIDLNFKN